LRKTLVKGHEKIVEPDRNDRNSAARLRLTYDDIDLKIVAGGQEIPYINPQSMLLLKKGISQAEAFGFLNRQGELYRYVTNSLAIDNPVMKVVAPIFSNDVLILCKSARSLFQIEKSPHWNIGERPRILLCPLAS